MFRMLCLALFFGLSPHVTKRKQQIKIKRRGKMTTTIDNNIGDRSQDRHSSKPQWCKHSYENHLSSKSLWLRFYYVFLFVVAIVVWLFHFHGIVCAVNECIMARTRAKSHFGPLNIPFFAVAHVVVLGDGWMVESRHLGIYFISFWMVFVIFFGSAIAH